MPLKSNDFDGLVQRLRKAQALLEDCYLIAHDGMEPTLARTYNSYVMNLSRDLTILDKMQHGQNGKH